MSSIQPGGALALSHAEMRTLGYQVIDLLIEHIDHLREQPVTRKSDRPALEKRLREVLSEQGTGAAQVLEQVERDVLSNIMYLDHPRFFAFVPSPSNFISVMADALVSGFNVFAGTWLEASGPAEGLAYVDLLSLDPHKWLFQPYEIGCVLVRENRWLKDTFHILPEYLKDIARGEEEINFCDYGIQLTRSFRALKLWMSLKTFGLEAFREAVLWRLRRKLWKK